MTQNMSTSHQNQLLLNNRQSYSSARLSDLRSSLLKREHVANFEGLVIYTTGSYGRLEASQYSDIDLFFMMTKARGELDELRVPEIRMLSDVIGVSDTMGFPKFSNDGEFLRLLFQDEMLGDLGGRTDDYNNHFTARMLLLLESRSVYNDSLYSECLRKTVSAYFRDYRYHPKDFQPIFLINDIIRFWKTLCLNYENRRNSPTEAKATKQKVKNFKLKFSRMLTCFGTIASLSAYKDSISETEVVRLCALTPLERIGDVSDRIPSVREHTSEVVDLYCWFLEQTALTTDNLEAMFVSKPQKTFAFDKAQRFGDLMFAILRAIDDDHPSLRYLVV